MKLRVRDIIVIPRIDYSLFIHLELRSIKRHKRSLIFLVKPLDKTERV